MIKLIDVNNEVVSCSVPLSNSFCPVANAINRLCNYSVRARVDGNIVVFVNTISRELTKTIQLSGDVRSRILHYDNTGLMESFQFELDIPEEFLRVA